MTDIPAGASENLLLALYRLAHRQQENFVTESFAHLLRHLLREEPDAAVHILTWLTEEGVFLRSDLDGPLKIGTQLATDEFGIPDLRVESDAVDVIVEVKLGSMITYEQVDAYRRELERKNRERRALVALLGYRPYGDLPEGTQIRTWGELGSKLSEEFATSGSDVTRYLVAQLLGLLNHLRLTPLKVRSRVSEGLLKHRAWADANPSLPAVTRTRLRSLRHLQTMEGCEPLFHLLMQMEHVLAHAEGVESVRFDSGPAGSWPWIGFNVNDLEFFFFLSLDNPEAVTVQRYRFGIDPDAFNGAFGELDLRSSNVVRWFYTADLADPEVGYFEKDGSQQVQVLAKIFESGFRYGRALPPVYAGDEGDGRSIGAPMSAP